MRLFLCLEANQREADNCALLGLLLEVAQKHSSSPALLSRCFTVLTLMCDSGCNPLVSEKNQREAAKLGGLELIKTALEKHAVIAEVVRSGLAALEAICRDGYSILRSII